MTDTGLNYGEWLSKNFKWNLFITIRRHFILTEFNTINMVKRLFEKKDVKTVFYTIEPDRCDNMSHMHLLIENETQYDNKKIADIMKINPKSVCSVEKVKDNDDVSYYISKSLWKKTSYYDLLHKDI
jgi:REP element-mobilizing transposase RayT